MADDVFLEFEIHLRDADRVAALQGAPPGETSTAGSGATAQKCIIRAPMGAAVEFGNSDNGGVPIPLIRAGGNPPLTGPYLTSRWWTMANVNVIEPHLPLNVATFTHCQGGLFGTCFLFGSSTRYYWRGVFLYDPPLETGTPGDEGTLRPPVMQRRWIDPAPGNMMPNRENAGTAEITRDAGKQVDTFGFAFRGQPFSRTWRLTEFNDGASSAKCSWERLYVRLRKVGTSTRIWKCENNVAHGVQINLLPSGQLAVYNVGSSTTLIATTPALDVGVTKKLDLLLRYGGTTFGADDYTGGGTWPGPRFTLFLNGLALIDFTPAAGIGLGEDSFHVQSIIGPTLGTETGEIDVSFWMNAKNPIIGTGIDFLNGSRVAVLRVEYAGDNHANWTGDPLLLSQTPHRASGLTPYVIEGLVSTTASARIEIKTDAEYALAVPGSIGVAGMMVTIWGHRGTSDGYLGYKIADQFVVLQQMGQHGTDGIIDLNGTQSAPKASRVMWRPSPAYFPLAPADITPILLEHEKGNDATTARIYSLQGVCELIGTFGEEDYPPDLAPGLKYPLLAMGPHNAPYPRSMWATTANPQVAPVLIKSGTYVGNGLSQELFFPVPPHFLWIRKVTGVGSPEAVRWWSSMTGPTIAGLKTPTTFELPVIEQDPYYVPATEGDVSQMQARVRPAGNHLESNRTGDTYAYLAVCDPGQRFMCNGAFAHQAAQLPTTDDLRIPTFTPQALFLCEQRTGIYDAIELLFKGPAHAGAAASKLNTASTAVPDAIEFGTGTITPRPGFGAEDVKIAAYMALRSDDGSGDPGAARVFGIGSYTGNGTTPREITHLPASARRPLWVLVVPTNGQPGYYKDCAMPQYTSFHVATGVASTTAIRGANLNAFTIGATLNASGVVYHYFLVWGGEVEGPGADGFSECGEFWPVPPVPPPCPTPTPDCKPKKPEPPGGGGGGGDGDDDGGGGGGGDDDIDTDLAVECVPYTKRIFNDALSRIGISKRIRLLTLPVGAAWEATTAYVVGDAAILGDIVLGEVTYYCVLAHTNHTPPNATYWTLTAPTIDNTEESDLCRQHYARAIETTLRDFPWPFATRYKVLTLLAGDPTLPVNRDWTYSYRQPLDCVFERRLAVVRDGAVDPTPPPFQLSFDTTGGRLFTNQAGAQLEYTARPACSGGAGDPLFIDALTWRLAAQIAGPLTRIADVTKLCLDKYDACLARAFAVLRPGNPGPRTTVDPLVLDPGAGALGANIAIVNRALVRIGARTVASLATDQSREADAARVLFEDELRSVLRDFPWAFATRYVAPVLVAGTATDPVNTDWTYAYRLDADVVKVRRLATKEWQRSRSERDPEMFRVGSDATGALLYCHRETPMLEVTARIPDCVLHSEALFRDALGWRLAASLAPSLALVDPEETEQLGRGPQDRPRERKATEIQLRDRLTQRAWQQYYVVLEKARVADATEQQGDSRDADADWIRGRE